jgi:hypothetical protein
MLHQQENIAERAKLDVATLGLMRRPARGEVSAETKAVRAVFGLLAWAGAAVAAFYAYDRAGSVWLSVFVGLMVLQLVGRGVADVITDPRKLQRTLYFLLGPALATAVLYGAYEAWKTWWLAFVLALVVGGILNLILASRLFPDIHREETEDTVSRWHKAV